MVYIFFFNRIDVILIIIYLYIRIGILYFEIGILKLNINKFWRRKVILY